MKVLVYPRGDNPYQELLYKELRKKQDDKYTYIEPTSLNIVAFPLILAINRVKGYKILHIHWLTFHTNIFKVYGKQLSLILTFWSLLWLKILQYKVVWTIHNVLPHEPLTSNDTAVARYLAKNAKAKIVHSSETTTQMVKLGIETKNNVVIPIGTYSSQYPNNISPVKARKILNIKDTEFVVLFFGQVRWYKGVDDLIVAMDELKIKNSRLIIAGICDDVNLTKLIMKSRAGIIIDFINKYIPDDEVATYFQACNIACLPFKNVTTSSSILVPMSFSKPVIAPRIGTLRDIPDDAALLYDSTEKDALKTLLQVAAVNKKVLNRVGDAGHEYSEGLSWINIAKKTRKLYQDVLTDSLNTVG